ncbi:hypothetical protein RCL1_006614 [Eukaryota sp. TZLM3-RCL]
MTVISFVLLLFLLWSAVESTYVVNNVHHHENGFLAILRLSQNSTIFNEPLLPELTLDVSCHSPDVLRIKVVDPIRNRFEVPDVVINAPLSSSCNFIIKPPVIGTPFSLSVHRSDGVLLFNTSSLIFSDHYLEIESSLAQDFNCYGLGIKFRKFLLDRNKKYSFWSKEGPGCPRDFPCYQTHPFLMANSPKANSFGIFFLNSNAAEIELGTNNMVFRSTGGIIDLFIYAGSSPKNVVKQHQSVTGKPVAIPYYALGFSQARWGWKTIQDAEKVYNTYQNLSLPLDMLFWDIDIYDSYYVFTLSPDRFPASKMAAFSDRLHSDGVRVIPIIDPGVPISRIRPYKPYTDLMKSGAYVLQEKKDVAETNQVWPGICVFPDFSHPNAYEFWLTQLSLFISQFSFDGTWYDMNGPDGMCDGICSPVPEHQSDHDVLGFSYNNPPWLPEHLRVLNERTLNAGARTHMGRFYDIHNLYAFYETKVGREVSDKLFKKRSLSISRSSFPGSQRYTSTWMGDNRSSFEDLEISFSQILQSSISGIPMTGADIGGFTGFLFTELFQKWHVAGILAYPFARNHAMRNSEDKYPYNDAATLKMFPKILRERYRLIPLWYTSFMDASLHGGTVLDPLWFLHPSDSLLAAYDTGVVLGETLLLVPVVEKGVTHLSLRLPTNLLWYNYHNGTAVKSGNLVLPVSGWDSYYIFMIGGSVLFRFNVHEISDAGKNLCHFWEKQVYEVFVALDQQGEAEGKLILDDGESLDLEMRSEFIAICKSSRCTIHWTLKNYKSVPAMVTLVRVSGVDNVKQVSLNGVVIDYSFSASVLTAPINFDLFSDGFDLRWV